MKTDETLLASFIGLKPADAIVFLGHNCKAHGITFAVRALILLTLVAPSFAADIQWTELSSKNGDLPVPGESTQQTGNLIADLDKDGTNDFVLSFREIAPALVWYRRTGRNWSRYVLEPELLTVEAGGAVYDIDGDGDLDIGFGGGWQSDEVWWWEKPYPNF